ncbi:MAG: hypothetical protein GF390_01805 [Candidatus Pacebacteria bacterium]|nr:hypothetical protein [Candidatus Paceibacterota bacterium]
MKIHQKLILVFLWLTCLFGCFHQQALAQQGQVLGIHILQPYELEQADQLLSLTDDDKWIYVTIPFTVTDLERPDFWRDFFTQTKERKVIPIIRLAGYFENGAWQVPNRKQLVDQIEFLSALPWPTEQRYLIVFNEVNHAAEWGGQLDPAGYVEVLKFVSNWAHTENNGFKILPAAMDLAAPNGGQTMEAFTYLQQMHQADPEIFSYLDVWNSHSYPNPGFSGSPQATAKNSLRGFEHELAWLKQKTGQYYPVMITETGWVMSRATTPWLESYYTYALQHIWSHPQVIAVTPFTLQGDPGPFAGFSFLDRNGQPTAQYRAAQAAVKKLHQDS